MADTSGTRWEKCAGKNKDGKCRKSSGTGAGSHITHKKHWLGGWYGMLSHKDPRDGSYGENGPQERRAGQPKRGKGGIWKW